jgi:hypothetical protein
MLLDEFDPARHGQALADFWAITGSQVAHFAVYSDGLIVYLAISAETQDRIVTTIRKVEREMGTILIGQARSKNGFGGVLILHPFDFGENEFGTPPLSPHSIGILELLKALISDDLTCQDNRDLDLHMLVDFGEFVWRLVKKMDNERSE